MNGDSRNTSIAFAALSGRGHSFSKVALLSGPEFVWFQPFLYSFAVVFESVAAISVGQGSRREEPRGLLVLARFQGNLLGVAALVIRLK